MAKAHSSSNDLGLGDVLEQWEFTFFFFFWLLRNSSPLDANKFDSLPDNKAGREGSKKRGK